MTLLGSPAKRSFAPSIHIGDLGTLGLLRSVLSGEEGLSRLVELQLSDFTVGWVNWDLNLLSVLLILDDLFNMDAPSSSVDGKNLSRFVLNSTFGTTTFNLDRVSLSYWDGSAVVLGPKLLAQVAAHHLSSKAAWGGEVGLSRLSSLTGN